MFCGIIKKLPLCICLKCGLDPTRQMVKFNILLDSDATGRLLFVDLKLNSRTNANLVLEDVEHQLRKSKLYTVPLSNEARLQFTNVSAVEKMISTLQAPKDPIRVFFEAKYFGGQGKKSEEINIAKARLLGKRWKILQEEKLDKILLQGLPDDLEECEEGRRIRGTGVDIYLCTKINAVFGSAVDVCVDGKYIMIMRTAAKSMRGTAK